MIIKKVKLYFEEKMVKVFPEKGEFQNGLNIIYSNENNTGKTTFSRSIIKMLFSSSIIFPKQNFGDIKKIELTFNLNKIRYFSWSDKPFKKIWLKYNNKTHFYDDKWKLIEYISNIEFPKIIKKHRVSYMANRFFLDQDYDIRQNNLIPSLFNARQFDYDMLDYFWIKRPIVLTYEDIAKTNELKKQIANLNKEREVILKLENAELSYNSSLNKKFLEDRKNELKTTNKQIKRISSEVCNINAQIIQFELMSGKNNKNIEKADSLYIVARDAKTNEPINVKVNLDEMLNFTITPIQETKSEAKVKIEELIEEKRVLENYMDNLEKKSNELTKWKEFNISVLNLSEIENNIEKLSLELKNILLSNKNIQKDNALLRKTISLFKNHMSTKIKEEFNEYSKFDSESGSDLFIDKSAKFISYIRELKYYKLPFLFDSIKEKDISNIVLINILKTLDGIANANDNQIIVSLTSPPSELLTKYKKNLFFISKLNLIK